MEFPPPSLNSVIPDITNDNDLVRTRRILQYLNSNGAQRSISNETLTQVSRIRDESGELIFTDLRDTSPIAVMAQQLAHIGALSMFYTSNLPLLIEDYLITISGELPSEPLPEFVWVVYTLSESQAFDFTILKDRKIANDKGETYTSMYSLTIPKGELGTEKDTNDRHKYMQLFRADDVGSSFKLTKNAKLRAESTIPYVKSLDNPLPSFGGRDPERFMDYRIRVFQTPRDQIIVTPNDYVNRVIDYFGPNTRAVVVGPSSLSDRGEINVVKLSAIKPDGSIVTNTESGLGLVDYLKEQDPNMIPRIVDPVFTKIRIKISVSLEANTDTAAFEIEEKILQSIATYSNPLFWPDWGEKDNTFTVDKLSTWIENYIPEIDYMKITIVSATKPGGKTYLPPLVVGVVSLEPTIGLPIIEIPEKIEINREVYI